jgi:cytochrome c
MHRAVLIILITATALSLSACEKSGSNAASGKSAKAPSLTATTLGEQTILSPKDYLAKDQYASADTSRGETLTMQCRACHSFEEGAAPIVGPTLHRVFGRTAGSAQNYAYSDALASSGFVWTPRALDAWLAEPFAFLPGNRMTFPGLPNGNDRNDLIAYLLQYTSSDAGTENKEEGQGIL